MFFGLQEIATRKKRQKDKNAFEVTKNKKGEKWVTENKTKLCNFAVKTFNFQVYVRFRSKSKYNH